MKQTLLLLAAVAVFIVAIGILIQRVKNNNLFSTPEPKREITVGGSLILIELADNPEKRQKGLSGRTSLPENEGVLFVFDTKNVYPAFWMKDTLIALDIIWIDDAKVVKISKNVQPETGKKDSELTRYYADKPIDFVLEVNAGFSDKNNIKEGEGVSGLP